MASTSSPAIPKAGDVLHPDSRWAGIARGRYRWSKSTLAICYQGYGTAADGLGWRLVEPRAWERSIIRLRTEEANYIALMTARYLQPDVIIDVRSGAVVVEGTALTIH